MINDKFDLTKFVEFESGAPTNFVKWKFDILYIVSSMVINKDLKGTIVNQTCHFIIIDSLVIT